MSFVIVQVIGKSSVLFLSWRELKRLSIYAKNKVTITSYVFPQYAGVLSANTEHSNVLICIIILICTYSHFDMNSIHNTVKCYRDSSTQIISIDIIAAKIMIENTSRL